MYRIDGVVRDFTYTGSNSNQRRQRSLNLRTTNTFSATHLSRLPHLPLLPLENLTEMKLAPTNLIKSSRAFILEDLRSSIECTRVLRRRLQPHLDDI